MKKLLLAIICCLTQVTMMGQQVNPSKTRLNNILLIDHGLKWPHGYNNLKELFYLKDLSFDDIQKAMSSLKRLNTVTNSAIMYLAIQKKRTLL